MFLNISVLMSLYSYTTNTDSLLIAFMGKNYQLLVMSK